MIFPGSQAARQSSETTVRSLQQKGYGCEACEDDWFSCRSPAAVSDRLSLAEPSDEETGKRLCGVLEKSWRVDYHGPCLELDWGTRNVLVATIVTMVR